MEPSVATAEVVRRRDFLRRGVVVAWSTPVIMSILSEHALAQTPSCGSFSGNTACPNNPTCPSSKPHCCANEASGGDKTCGCYTATGKVGKNRCNPA